MTAEIELWGRPEYRRTPTAARVLLLAFGDTALDEELALSAATYGMPSTSALDGFDIRMLTTAEHPDWIDNWRTGALRTIAEDELAEPGRLDAARFCFTVGVELPDPPDLGHLQAAWAAAKWLAARGAFAVLDVWAARWVDAARLAALDPARPFDLDQQVSFVCETQPTRGFGHAMHTRGMVKFARPDLMAGVEAADIGLMHQVMRRLAGMTADGRVIPVGQRFRADADHVFAVVPCEPGVNAPEVNLGNDALLIVPA
jgi:hypothetical protein